LGLVTPVLIGLALFGVVWMVKWEMRLRNDYAHGLTGSHIYPGLYFPHIVLALLLLVASLALLFQKTWTYILAALLAGLVLAHCVFRFWILAEDAEVTRFSYAHLEIWLRLFRDEMFRLVLASVILLYSLIRVRTESGSDRIKAQPG